MTIVRLSTHVLDTTLGRPAAGIPAALQRVDGERADGAAVDDAGAGVTDDDGRVFRLNAADLAPGRFRLTLDTAAYFARLHGSMFYPQISVSFALTGDREHYHIAVLTSTYSYSTYLGS